MKLSREKECSEVAMHPTLLSSASCGIMLEPGLA